MVILSDLLPPGKETRLLPLLNPRTIMAGLLIRENEPESLDLEVKAQLKG
jgi:hypothetical protein